MIFEKVKKQHLLEGIRDFEEKGFPHGFGPSSTYDVLHEGKLYPPKAIMAYANFHASSRKIERYFKGGIGTDCFKAIERCGFEIRKKDIQDPYNWTQTHEELATYLKDKRNNTDLLVKLLENAGVSVGTDQEIKGEKTEIKELDPFTFFCYIYKYGDKRRLEILQHIASELDLTYPEGERGIPSANAQKVWMFPYAYERVGDEFDILWELFEAVRSDTVSNELFQRALDIRNVGKTKITEVLFYIKPFDFFPINGPSKPFLSEKLEIDPEFSNYEEYQSIIKQIKEKTTTPFPQLSYEAWEFSNEGNKKLISSKMFEDAEQELIDVLSSSTLEDVDFFFNTLDRLFNEAEIDSESEKLSMTVRKNRLNISIGQRYAFNLAPKLWKGNKWAIMSSDHFSNQSTEPYANEPEAYLNYFNDTDLVEKNTQGIIGVWKNTYDRTEKSSYRKSNNIALVKAVSDKVYREALMAKVNFNSSINYWIFQGNPNVYNITNALKAGHLKSWKVAAHKDKINVGDKVIIWQTGENAGCYALATVSSEVENLKEEEFETLHYIGKGLSVNGLRVKLKITHYMADDPIYWNDIKDNPVFSNFKAGNQGTNFSATKDQFETLSSFKNLKTLNLKANMQQQSILSFMPLNQILYGPPGTGKTYITKKLAIKLIDGTVPKDNKEVNARYLQLLNAGFIDFTTFHQSMTYEDFLEGIKPVLNESEENVLSYEIKDGIFKQICDRSNTNIDVNVFEDFDSSWEKLMELIRNKILKDEKLKIGSWEYGLSSKNSLKYSSLTSPSQYTFTITKQNVYDVYQGKQARPSGAFQKDMLDVVEFMKDHFDLIDFDKNERNSKINKNNYVLIVDEINRGNVASIFGELITLIEKDKRAGAENELSVILPYSKQKFSVPSNLHIIGTMNTADRSIEALDSALRRRFEFIEMLPDYKVIDEVLNNQKFNGHKLSNILKTINERITVLIDRDHQIGHSYFLKLKESTDLEADLKAVFQNKIIPLLQEYFFNDYVKIAMVIGEGFMDKDRYAKVTFAQNDGDYESDYSDIVKYEIKKEIDLSDAIDRLMGKVSE